MMSIEGFDVFAETLYVENAVGLYLVKDEGERRAIVDPMTATIRTVERGSVSVEHYGPTLRLRRPQAVALVTALWKQDIRPQGIVDDSSRVELLKEHIADLRAQLATKDEQLKQTFTVLRELNSIIGDQP